MIPHVGLTLIVVATLLNIPSQERQTPGALPMIHLEACRIELTPLSASADFVGTVEYRATVNGKGVLTRLKLIRQVGNPREEVSMRRFVRLDQFESCVQRWQFGAAGDYRLTLQGGTMSNEWRITVARAGKSVRLVVLRGL